MRLNHTARYVLAFALVALTASLALAEQLAR